MQRGMGSSAPDGHCTAVLSHAGPPSLPLPLSLAIGLPVEALSLPVSARTHI